MSAVHPLDRAWISTGGTGAQNYDEFADEGEITAVVRDNPFSALAVEMPHRAPDTLGSFAQALPAAADRLRKAQDSGAYRQVRDLVVAYRISDPAGRVSHGLFVMAQTAEISASAGQPGRVIRNEDVFAEKVRERVELLRATGHLLSAVLLLQTRDSAALEAALAAACAGEPAVVDVDPAGRRHELWPVEDPPTVRDLCDLAGGGELVVADGNHRSLAAQTAGLERFLAVVSTPGSVDLRPYHRLLSGWPPDRSVRDALLGAGAVLTPLTGPAEVPDHPGVVHLHTAEGGYAVTLPQATGASGVERLDHAVVERVLLTEVLGWDPGDPRITYVGGDYPAAWLRDQVDQGRADVAVLIAPVRVADFVATNLAREKMPRKSTWFVPKVRAGLVVAPIDPLG